MPGITFRLTRHTSRRINFMGYTTQET